MTERRGGDVAHDEDEFLVRVRFTADLDRDRITQWLDANYKDEFVEVVDRKTGDIVEISGEAPSPFLCPQCGEYATSIIKLAGEAKYTHPNREPCEVVQ